MYARAQLAPLACMLHTMLRLRSNVLRLTKLSQRPVPEPTKGVGLWGTLLMFEVIRIYRRDIRRDRTSLPCARLGVYLGSYLGVYLGVYHRRRGYAC